MRGAVADPGHPRCRFLSCRARPRGRRHGHRGRPGASTPVALLTEVDPRVVGPDRGRIAGAPFWSEASVPHQRSAFPTVYFAPGDIRICHTLEERVPVEEYLDGIAALAEFIARYCGVAT